MSNWIREKEEKATLAVRDLVAKPTMSEMDFPLEHEFDPWSLFPCLLGSYSSAFDDLAIDVLTDLRDGTFRREDLAGQMFREMLCTSDLCDYGTSPRVCFPTTPFKAVLPELISKWEDYRRAKWEDRKRR